MQSWASPDAWRSGSGRCCSSARQHVSIVIGPDGYRALPTLIDSARAGCQVVRRRLRPGRALRGFQAAAVRQGQGVDSRCSAAAIIAARTASCPTHAGPERSRALADVVRETGSRRRRRDVGSRLARPDGELATTTAPTTSPICCAPLAASTAFAAFASPVRIPTTFSERVIDAMATTPTVCEHVHLPMQSGSIAHPQAHACAGIRASNISSARRGCARRFRGSPSRRTSSSDFPARPTKNFAETLECSARGRFRRRLHVQVLACATAPPPRGCRPTWRCPTRSRASGWRD